MKIWTIQVKTNYTINKKNLQFFLFLFLNKKKRDKFEQIIKGWKFFLFLFFFFQKLIQNVYSLTRRNWVLT